MWVYDGENWINENAASEPTRDDRSRIDDRMMPELQIVPREDLERPRVPIDPRLPVQPGAEKWRRRGPKIGHA